MQFAGSPSPTSFSVASNMSENVFRIYELQQLFLWRKSAKKPDQLLIPVANQTTGFGILPFCEIQTLQFVKKARQCCYDPLSDQILVSRKTIRQR
jgi:hypothetical protein